ncbi:gamma-glutamyltransferase family protein [Meiothermus sp. QL-1]|uniref:gamma-glutamyltransferase family protein n=1 Tax=Meiothermus sp. QL-1 TaxID=2058095 RepID=UPI000E0AAD85|nr:gamma-glutamyltransferase family protein [Meiothermus sp. QL-1]RDI96161.1 gamma-glutamyltransferase family protein [Meiothermus sp. QL-1]
MNLNHYPYPSRRHLVVGKRGAVATSQPQAALAGMEMLLQGGSAADAAVAMAIALTVLEPTSNGIGSDAFALVHDGQRLYGLDASGHSPAGLSFEAFAAEGRVPTRGWPTVTVPGAPSAWRALHQRFGRLPFEALFAPALRYAREGFAVSPEVGRNWARAEAVYGPLAEACYQPFKEVFLPGGRAPRPGEVWQSPQHAETLEELAKSGCESLYTGPLAARLADFAADTGGYLTRADLAAHRPAWVEPLSVRYRDLEVHELPPPTQGLAALIALGLLGGFELGRHPRDSAEGLHLQIEAMKLAFAEVQAQVADPRFMRLAPSALLDPARLAQRRGAIGERALFPSLAAPQGGTVYLAAADGELWVSFIQSNYMGFGSGIVVEGTGIALQNRGAGFVLEEGHPNRYAPSKRPFHTIIPGFLTREGKPLGPFGVMGGHMQPQGHLQVVVALADYGLNPQAALDAPRWQWVRGRVVELEPTFPLHAVQGLRERGHEVVLQPEWAQFGRGQIVLRHGGALLAATEPRADGMALAW